MKPIIKHHIYTIAWINWFGKTCTARVSDVDAFLRRNKKIIPHLIWVDV
jgi:hypothetical protein